MIPHRFTVENYRGFLRPTTIELRPLTLIFGHNSSGKSALVRFLPLLAESLIERAAPIRLDGEIGRDCGWVDLTCRAAKRFDLIFDLEWPSGDEMTRAAYKISGDPEGRFQDLTDIFATRGDASAGLRSNGDGTYQLIPAGMQEKTTFSGLIPDQDSGGLRPMLLDMAELAREVQWVSGVRQRPEHRESYGGAPPRTLRSDGSNAARFIAYAHLLEEQHGLRDRVGAFFGELGQTMAARLLSEPLGLLLENFEHDLDFLKAHLPPGMLANVKKQIDEGWILVLNGGGSVLGDHLRQRAEEPVRRLRTWVMFDSDRLHPDEQEPAWDGRAPNGKDASCQALGWTTTCDSEYHERFWALHRRSIENYLPMSELEVYDSREPDHLDWVGAFARLSDAQRWYFNMKRGLAGDRTDPALSRTRGQYDNLPGPDRALLERGLGRHLSDHYKMAMQRRFAWDDQARDEAKAALADLQRLL